MRVLRGRPAQLSVSLEDGEDLVDADGAVTVAVVDDAGVVLTGGAATRDGVGQYSYTLPGADIPDVTTLTVTWSATIDGNPTEIVDEVEVCGGVYFSLRAGRAYDSALSSTDKYPAEVLAEARDMVEDECEDITQVAWVPRYRRVLIDGDGSDTLELPDFMVRRIFSCSIDGVALDSDELADLVLDEDGLLHRRSGFFANGVRNVDIAYEHGYNQPYRDLVRASMMRFANAAFAVKSGIPDRATSFQAAPGGVFSIATAGKGSESWTGVPEVDSTYARRRHDKFLG